MRRLLDLARKHPLIVVALVAIATQTVFNAITAGRLESDSSDYSEFYEPVAQQIAAGHGAYLHGEPATFWPIGYPLILAAIIKIGGTFWVMPVLVTLIGATAAIFFRLVREIFDVRVAWIASALWIAYPINLYLGAQPLSEIPFRLILYSALLLVVLGLRRRDWRLFVAAGGLTGAGILIRPAALALPFLFAAVLLVSSRRLIGPVVALLIAALVVIAPWQAWLMSSRDEFAVISSSGTAAIVDGLTIGTDKDEERDDAFPPDVVEFMADASAHRGELDSYSHVRNYLAEQIRERPVTVGKWLAIKTARAFYATESRTYDPIVALIQLPFLALIGVGILLVARRHRTIEHWLLVGVAIGFLLMTVMVLPTARQMTPSVGLLLGFAGFGVSQLRLRPDDTSLQQVGSTANT